MLWEIVAGTSDSRNRWIHSFNCGDIIASNDAMQSELGIRKFKEAVVA